MSIAKKEEPEGESTDPKMAHKKSSGDAMKAFVLRTRGAQDIFDYFFRSNK